MRSKSNYVGKVKLFLCFIKQDAMKAYVGMEV